VEKMRYSLDLVHTLEDSFVILLEIVYSPNIFKILEIKFVYKFPKESLGSEHWRKHVQRKQLIKCRNGCISIMISLD
jgi:hypothetical protein